jgi:hypothetical protein
VLTFEYLEMADEFSHLRGGSENRTVARKNLACCPTACLPKPMYRPVDNDIVEIVPLSPYSLLAVLAHNDMGGGQAHTAPPVTTASLVIGSAIPIG